MRRRNAISGWVCGLTVLFLASAQENPRVTIVPRNRPERSSHPGSNIRLDVNLVLIPVTVTDPMGRPLSGLKRDVFQVFEDGIKQRITWFATEDVPVSAGVVFDASGSMERKLDKSREAVSQLFKTSIPGDEFFLVQFNTSPKLLCPFTTDIATVQNELLHIRAKGWTSLFDAVYLAIHQMRHAKNPRRALLVLSDGGDNNSRYTEAEIRGLIRESEVSIYTIGMLGSDTTLRRIRLLRELAEETGGHFYPVHSVAQLPEVINRVSAALRNQYLLGYYPTNSQKDGKYRKVEIQLAPPPDFPPLHASWRVGYYAPASY